ncbi:MAG: hypothetical protein OIF56_00140 [Cohaesibacter sp.]|nr:hypothetical protein [Cohaesibacter sp.]
MVKIDIVPATKDHAKAIAPYMRQADRDEVMAGSGHLPLEALLFSLNQSDQAWTGRVDGVPAVMFGVGTINLLYRIGAPWLLGTEAVERHSLVFLRHSMLWKSHLLSLYDELHNVVDDRNDVSKRWLVWLGFELGEPFDLGNGICFRSFWMRNLHV